MKGYGRYSQAYQQTAVNTVDQRKLILMLYDGAIKFLSIAAEKISEDDSYEAHRNLIRGKSVIAELLASLNLERGGEIASNLQRLYAYMFNELIEANLSKDVMRIRQVVDLLKELRTGWQNLKAGQTEGPSSASAGQGGAARKNINVRG